MSWTVNDLLLTIHEASVGSTAHLSHNTQFKPSLSRLSSTTRITGSLATVLSVKIAIFAFARSLAGSSAIMLEKSIPTSVVAPCPNRRVEEAI